MGAQDVQFVNVGVASEDLFKGLDGPIRELLGVEAYRGKAGLLKPSYAFNKVRNQYHCHAIEKRLLTVKDTNAHWVIGVTDVDLFEPDSDFVFGNADRDLKVGVLSTFRLGETAETIRNRLFKLAGHLAAHLYGMSVCEDGRCIMYHAQSLPEFDKRNLAFCSNCRNELARIRARYH